MKEIVIYEGKKNVREEHFMCSSCGTCWRFYGETCCPFCHKEIEMTKPVKRVVPAVKIVSPMVKLQLLIQEKKLELAEHQYKADSVFVSMMENRKMSELKSEIEKAVMTAAYHRRKVKIITNIISELERKLK